MCLQKLFSPFDVRLRASLNFTRLETMKDSFVSLLVRLFGAFSCFVACSLLFRTTITSTSVPALLDREVGDHQDIVSLCLISVLHLWELDKYRDLNKQFLASNISYKDIAFGERFRPIRSLPHFTECESFVLTPR